MLCNQHRNASCHPSSAKRTCEEKAIVLCVMIPADTSLELNVSHVSENKDNDIV